MDLNRNGTWKSVALASVVVMAGSVGISWGETSVSAFSPSELKCSFGQRKACGSLSGCLDCCGPIVQLTTGKTPGMVMACKAACNWANTMAPFPVDDLGWILGCPLYDIIVW